MGGFLVWGKHDLGTPIKEKSGYSERRARRGKNGRKRNKSSGLYL